MTQIASTEEHTLIHVICDACGECNLLTIVEHARESKQTRAIADAHHTVAEQHSEETGHHVEVGETADDAEAIVETARSMAPSVQGVEPEDFEGAMLHE